ncbi:MAG TPA: hypothetical protein VFA12_04575 [Stellaceae bacterium]|nr:hypothetical protein [Stellaceae bacterium]
MPWTQVDAGAWPTIAVCTLAFVALAQSLLRPRLQVLSLVLVLLCGTFAIIVTVRQKQAVEGAVAAQAAEVSGLRTRLRAIGSLASDRPLADGAVYEAVKARLAALDREVGDLKNDIARWKERSKTRFIDGEAAAEMAAYLRTFGSHRVVVSCVPNDMEAYNYANQLANILRAAGWEALGPQLTSIFGNPPGVGVNLYVHGATSPDAARILVAAFAKFNIPYQSRVEPSRAIPDTQTVELFVATKPAVASEPASSAAPLKPSPAAAGSGRSG